MAEGDFLMKAEYINPFITASAEMIGQVARLKTKMDKFMLKMCPIRVKVF